MGKAVRAIRMVFLLCRTTHILIVSAMVLTFSSMPCHAADRTGKTAVSTGKKKLLLFAKNPATWAILRNGASGTMIYRESTGAFTLNAEKLHARSMYALVRISDGPAQVEILARGASDGRGKLELGGVWRNWAGKFWLVSGEDVAGNVGEVGSQRAWRPERYIFEEKPLGIPCNCPEPEVP